MSIHTEIADNTPQKEYIEQLCRYRRERMNNPCKGCKFGFLKEGIKGFICVFPSCPEDWVWLEGRES